MYQVYFKELHKLVRVDMEFAGVWYRSLDALEYQVNKNKDKENDGKSYPTYWIFCGVIFHNMYLRHLVLWDEWLYM